jgi:hypothetical protein
MSTITDKEQQAFELLGGSLLGCRSDKNMAVFHKITLGMVCKKDQDSEFS